jgi:hypothetical protein
VFCREALGVQGYIEQRQAFAVCAILAGGAAKTKRQESNPSFSVVPRALVMS